MTYGSILGSLCTAALECDAVALVLETLRSDQTLDARSLGVWLGTLLALLWLDLTTDDELANLQYHRSATDAVSDSITCLAAYVISQPLAMRRMWLAKRK